MEEITTNLENENGEEITPEVSSPEVNEIEASDNAAVIPEETAPTKAKKPVLKGIVVFAAVAVVAIATAVIIFLLGANGRKYKEAQELLDDGDYAEAYEIFKELGDYKDAEEIAGRFRYVPTKVTSEGESGGYENMTIKLSYNEDNLIKQYVKQYKDDSQEIVEYTYDKKYNCIKEVYTDRSGGVSVTERIYDENGNVVREVYAYDDEECYTHDYIYNDDGNVIKCTTIDESGKSITDYIYNENGDIVKQSEKDQNGKISSYANYTYDEKGNNIKSEVKYENMDYGYVTENFYEGDNLVQTVTTINYGITEFETTTDYTYDKKGNAITVVTKSVYDDLEFDSEIRTENTYDENGNLIKSVSFSNGEQTGTREIKYKLVYLPIELTDEEYRELFWFLTY